MFRTLALVAALLGAAVSASAQPLPDDVSSFPWVLDGGTVAATVRVGDMVYVGGDFTALALRSRVIGPFGVFDAATAELRAADPSLTGQVRAIVDDGAGGWILSLGHRLVRIDAAGRQVPWAPQPSGSGFFEMRALARDGGRLFIGGSFAAFAGQPRGRLAVVDIATQSMLPLDPAVSGNGVYALLVHGGHLYVGGSFDGVGGLPRSHLARLDLATGTWSAWGPSVASSGSVNALAAIGGRVYFSGGFDAVDGQTRLRVAASSADTGALDAFAPLVFSTLGGSFVSALATTGTTLFIGGTFDRVGADARMSAAAFDTGTGTLLPWSPLASGSVLAMSAVADGIVVAGQRLVSTATPTVQSAFKISAVTGTPLVWQPGVGGAVSALFSDGARVAFGGLFTTYRSVPAAHLVGFNLADGSYSTFPTPDSGVKALAVEGTRLFAGGTFSSVGGAPRTLLAAFDTATRQLLPFAPLIESQSVFAQVTALHADAGSLFVGGGFDLVNGSARGSLAAVDTASGALLAWAPGAVTGDAFRGIASIVTAAGRVWVGGRFSAVGGVARSGFAVFDATTAALTAVDPTPDQPTNRLSLDGGYLYAQGDWSQFGGLARPWVARLDPQTGVVDPAWQFAYPGAGPRLAVLGGELTAVGSFSNPSTGLASFGYVVPPPPYTLSRTSWTPTLSAGARDVWAFPDGVFATALPGFSAPSPYFFRRRSPGGAPLPVVDLAAHVQGDIVTLRWTPSLQGPLPTQYRLVAGSRPGASDLADLVLGPTPSLGVQLPAGRYHVRIAARANGVESPLSPEVVFIAGGVGCTTAPDAPALTAQGTPPLLLTWAAPPQSVSGFELRAGLSPGALGLLRLPLPAASNAFSTAGAPPGTYYVALAAVNACGVSVLSNEVAVVVPPPAAPSAPSGLTASLAGTTVALSWTPPAGAITGYVLEAGSAPGLANIIPALPLGGAPGIVAPNVPPGTYYVRVRAANGALVSAPSNEIVVTVP